VLAHRRQQHTGGPAGKVRLRRAGTRTGAGQRVGELRRVGRGDGTQPAHGLGGVLQQVLVAVDQLDLHLAPDQAGRRPSLDQVRGDVGLDGVVGHLGEHDVVLAQQVEHPAVRPERGDHLQRPVAVPGTGQGDERRRWAGGAVVERLLLLESTTRVALVTLGCARNEVDSEELAGRLAAEGFELVADATDADAVLVNTCGFIEAAKRESVDALLSVGGTTPDGRHRSVVAVGCMAERYGTELAAELPEADAVLGFDDYPEIGERLRVLVAGGALTSHVPRDRRTLLPMAPTDRPGAGVHIPGHRDASGVQPGAPDGPGPAGPGWLRQAPDDRSRRVVEDRLRV
jgi:hypothetical protein